MMDPPVARIQKVLQALVVGGLIGGAPSACNLFHEGSTSPSPTALVERFSGSLKQQGSVIFTFTVAQASTVDVTLTALAPATTAPATVGVGLGTPSGDACTVTTSASSVAPGATPQLSVAQSAGSYCVRVFDTGGLSQTVTVNVTVSHS
jgi:hypothetical protein